MNTDFSTVIFSSVYSAILYGSDILSKGCDLHGNSQQTRLRLQNGRAWNKVLFSIVGNKIIGHCKDNDVVRIITKMIWTRSFLIFTDNGE